MSRIGHNGPPLSEGWIARHRAVRDHWLVGHGLHVKPADPTRKRTSTQGEAWEDLCMECRYLDGTVMNGGRKMELRRGELIGAVSWLGSRWNWTPKTVRRFLDQLEADGMIELKSPGVQNGTQKGKQSTVITVCNYELYQSMRGYEGQAKEQAEGEQRASTGQAEGTQGASKGQAEGNIYKEEQRNKGTKEQNTPHGARADDRSGQEKGRAFWANAMAVPGAFNPDDGVERDPVTGSLQLLNGVKASWLARFEGSEDALNLALIQAAQYVKPNAAIPLRAQVEGQLAKQLGWKLDKAKSEKQKAPPASLAAQIAAHKQREKSKSGG